MARFFKDTAFLFLGTAFSQLIAALLIPVLGRLYAPAEYGIYSTVFSIAVILSVCMSLRFENALILPKKDLAAGALLRFVLFLVLIIFGISTIVFTGVSLLAPQGHDVMQWLWVVPLLAAGMNLVQTGMLFGNRHQRYKTVAVNAITLQAAYGIAAVVMGLASLGAVGLIFGRIIGQGAAALHMWPLAHALSTAHGTKLTSRKGGYFLRRYRQFPIYNLPSTLLMTAARESLVIVFGLFGFAHAAGLAGMVRAGLLIPVGLMSASIGQVFLKQAVIHNGKRAFADFTFWLAAGLLISMTPGFAFLIAWADPIVMTILGPGWTGAGTYAALLAPVTLMQALNIWFMRVLEVTGHQHVNFRLQSVLDTGSIAGVVALLMLGHTPLTALACYACLQMVYQLLLTRAVFRYSKLSLNRFLAMIGGALAVSSLPLGLHVLFGDSTNMGAQFVREGAVMLVMTLILSVFFLARLKRAQAAYLAEPEI